MIRSLVALAVFVALNTARVAAVEFRFGGEGLDIDSGSLGKFTLEYPQLMDGAQKPAHKLLEKNASGKTATLKYDGGAQLELAAADDGKITIKLAQLPANVKSIGWEMKIPIAFNQGGSWKIGAREGAFPTEKPAKPQLFQDHGRTLRLTNYEGKSLDLQTPEYAFIELTDNREWGWAIFNWRVHVPLADRKELIFNVTAGAQAAGAKPLVDAFGQSTRAEWPGKVKTLEELKGDVAAEAAYYESLHPPKLDAFGGLPGSKEKLGLKATGFFHVEKKGERWLLVDPAGNAFFHLGLCSLNPNEDYTLVKGRESAYAWLPKQEGEFASTFRKEDDGRVFSFHLANMIRKYGQPYTPEDYTARMIARMRKWGFNSGGAFSSVAPQARNAAHFPIVAHLPLNEWEGIARLPSIGETFDPFDEKTRARVEENMARVLPAQAKDPLIIGYFIVNEPIYENIPHMVPALDGKHACKRRLVQWLETKYKTIAAYNTAWGAQAGAFADLPDRVLNVKTDAAKSDVREFTGVFLEAYFKLVAESFRRHDKNHLLIGCRLQPGTINDEPLCRIAGKYLDVMSFNYYTDAVDKDLLRRIHGWTGGLPMMLSEFYWSASRESGLAGGREVATQQERGLAYRNYVEQSAALGFVIGIEWFTLIDQSVTGRWFQGFDGERANTGVLSVADRPWRGMLDEAVKTNHDIYRVWLGERAPFSFENPRFRPAR
jgi:hypothetical protein